jgi:hypothetical protein
MIAVESAARLSLAASAPVLSITASAPGLRLRVERVAYLINVATLMLELGDALLLESAAYLLVES